MDKSAARTQAFGYFLVFFAAINFGMMGPISRYPLGEGMSALECAFWRAVFGATFFIINGLLIKAWRIGAKERTIFCLFGIPGVSCLFFLYTFSVQEAGAATAAVLFSTAPIWVAIMSYFFFKELFSGSKVLSIILAIAGATCLVVSGGGLPEGSSLTGILAGLGSGFLFSMHAVISKKYLGRNINPVSIYMHILPAGTLCMLPFVEFMPGKTWQIWLSLAVTGFFGNWIAFKAFCAALSRLPATRVSVVETACEPFFAALLAYIFWGEMFRPLGAVGALLVVIAVVLIVLSKDTKKSPVCAKSNG